MSSIFYSLIVALVAGCVVATAAMTCTTVYLHRALSHRAVVVTRPIALLFRTFIWISTGIKPKEWVAVHRKHHAFSDEIGDPHSPVLLGWTYVQKNNVALYRAAIADPQLIPKYARDIPDDKWDRVFFGHQKSGLLLGIGLLMVVLGPWTGLLAAFIHANVYLASNAAVNAMGHHFGRRPYPNKATNLQWLAFITMGEGLHNNHHAAPTSPRLSHRWHEIDFGWWVIRFLSILGMAKVRFSDIRLSSSAKSVVS